MRWTEERANQWYAAQKWPVGINYVTSTAVNSTEMWQEETYDRGTILRELALAARAGFNSCRVFLPFCVWQADGNGFMRRLEDFLTIASVNGISVMPVLFDDCAFSGREPHTGPQSAPVPGVHNSGWTASPGFSVADDPAMEKQLAAYVKHIIGTHAKDTRVLLWDLYNEPGNSDRGANSLPLLENVFAWAREIAPSQPLTAAAWIYRDFDMRAPALSDVVTFHDYSALAETEARVELFKPYGRPIICTEWLCRAAGSRFESHLPMFHRNKIGAYNWGLVVGKTQTNLSWDTLQTPNTDPSALWQHDLFRADGTPYDAAEITVLQQTIV